MIRKATLTALGGLLVVGAGLYLFGSQGGGAASAEAPPADPPEVPVSEVIMRPIAPTVQLTGHVAAVQSVEVRPRVGGYLHSVSVPEGGLVKRGQVLFQIDARPFRAALDGARANLARAEEQHALARTEFERAQRLLERRVVSQERYDAAEAARRETAAAVQAARAAVTAAELDLDYTQVRAPIAGRVSRALVTEGNLVAGGAAGSATLLTTIVSVDPVHVHFDIGEPIWLSTARSLPSAGRADRDLPVRVGLVNEDGLPHAGRLDFVDNRVDRTTGTVRARAVLRNAEGLLMPGAFARVELTTGSPRPTVLIADEAIGTAQGKRFVLAVTDKNVVEQRPVLLGPSVDGLRVVTEGLAAGDRIVLKGLVRPGMTIRPRLTPMAQQSSVGSDAPTRAKATQGAGEQGERP